jgi:hypothetical protein
LRSSDRETARGIEPKGRYSIRGLDLRRSCLAPERPPPAIYQHIPNSQLAILPNATHMVSFDDPGSFNAVVERFLRVPFLKKDRIGDALRSLEKMRTSTSAAK